MLHERLDTCSVRCKYNACLCSLRGVFETLSSFYQRKVGSRRAVVDMLLAYKQFHPAHRKTQDRMARTRLLADFQA